MSDIEKEVFAVQSENEKNYPDTISMEEYLLKRKKMKEDQVEAKKNNNIILEFLINWYYY